MKKHIFTILLLTINSIAFGQLIELESIQLLNSKISASDTAQIEILGNSAIGNVYEVKSKVNVQVSCSIVSGEWEDRINEYRISIVKDSNCELLDSLYNRISNYWIEKEKWSDKYQANGDFSSLTVRDGFYKIGKELIIPMVKTNHENEGKAYQIFYYNNHLYKVELVKSSGFGGLSSFIEQNLQIGNGNRTYKLNNLVRQLDETKKLIGNKKNCN